MDSGFAGYLRTLYEEHGYTVSVIALFIGKPRETVRRWLVAAGVTLRPRGPRPGVGSKLASSDVANIRQRLEAGEAQAVIARAYDVSRQTIHLINSGQIWTGGNEGKACRKKDKKETPSTCTTRTLSS